MLLTLYTVRLGLRCACYSVMNVFRLRQLELGRVSNVNSTPIDAKRSLQKLSERQDCGE